MVILISETTAFLCFLAYASFFEWTLHKYLMHTPFWQYPFRRSCLGSPRSFPDRRPVFSSRCKDHPKGSLRLVERPVYYPASPTCAAGYKERWTQTYWQAPCQRSSSTIFSLRISPLLHAYSQTTLARNDAWFRWLDSHHHMHHKRHFNNLNVVLPPATSSSARLFRPKIMALPDREDGATVGLLLSES